MLHVSSDGNNRNGYLKKTPFTFFSNLFKRKKYHDDNNDVRFEEPTFTEMERGGSESVTSYGYGAVPRVPSSLSVTAVDIVCPPSPAASTLTLTPGRTRDIDQDMAALRLSRQDNPFLQVLQASRESLADDCLVPEESESDDANLMSQEFDLEVDPLTLPEIHEHMIRSPPPVTWPKSPNFKVFRFQSSDEESSQESLHRCGKKEKKKRKTPSLEDCVRDLPVEALASPRSQSRARDLRVSTDRSPNPFSLLNPDVRRLHSRSSDDNVQLVSQSEDLLRP
ncbi:uncharacterized protein [Anabrus simplex]|uniref:uncharacterized protein n=1 Tax=Anabrus simplex TaxID=316456 RepID=UPI0035A38962